MSVKNELFYVNITVDLLYENRVNPTTKLWTHKNRRLVRDDWTAYKYPEYRMNEDPVIIMYHRSKMFDLIESSQSTFFEKNSFSTLFSHMINGAQKLASESWRSISDAIFPQEQASTDDSSDEEDQRVPIWHPSKLDKIVNFESVLHEMNREFSEN